MKTDLIGRKGMSEFIERLRGKAYPPNMAKARCSSTSPCIHAAPFQEESLLKMQGWVFLEA